MDKTIALVVTIFLAINGWIWAMISRNSARIKEIDQKIDDRIVSITDIIAKHELNRVKENPTKDEMNKALEVYTKPINEKLDFIITKMDDDKEKAIARLQKQLDERK